MKSTAAGSVGGAVAGVLGGLVYGVAVASAPGVPDLGAHSIFALLLALNVIVGALGGFGVSLGFATAATLGAPRLRIAGAALGGCTVGAAGSLLGIDAFGVLLGEPLVGITGGLEGGALGGALALGLLLRDRGSQRFQASLGAGVACALTGPIIVLSGGRLMAGSLDLLTSSFVDRGLPLKGLQPFFAAMRFDGFAEVMLGGLEGILFGLGVGSGIIMTDRGLGTDAQSRAAAREI